jgi:peptide/nickel transport system permease protein
MLRALLRRLVLSIPLLFVVSILTFVLTGLIPGNAAYTILGTRATPAAVAAINKALGLDRPVLVQYWSWLTGVFHGDLGSSLVSGQSVTTILANGLPITLTLIVGALIVSIVVGIPVGVLSARRAKSGGQLLDAFSIVGYAIPPFFLGLLLTLVFSDTLNLLPPSGWVDPSDSFSGWFQAIILPIVTLAVPGAAIVARQTRQGMLDVLGRDFIRSLRARGLKTRAIIYKHALRNALGNVVTLLGLYVVSLLLGTTLVETVFAMQGLGSIAVSATNQHDLPVLEGAALYFTVVVVVAFAVVDVARAALNPKLRGK